MPIDGMFLHKLIEEIKPKLLNGRIETIDGLNKTDFYIKVHKPGENSGLYLSISYNNPTIFLVNEKQEKPNNTQSFTMFLRKHFEGSKITNIYQYNNDRVLFIECSCPDEFEGLQTKKIVIELIGRFSNLLILDENNKIIEALKQLSVLEENSRGIMKGLVYEPLISNKISPYDKNKMNELFSNFENLEPSFIVKNVEGVSLNLATYLINKYRDSNLDFYSFFINKTSSLNPVSTSKDFYYFNIFNEDTKTYDSISDLLYDYYLKNAKEKILKDNNQEIYKCVQSNLKRIRKKLIKLDDELLKDKNSDDLRLKGELLLSNSYSNIKRSNVVTLLNYYTNEYIDISIDPSKSLKDNSQIYYKKYKKSKLAIEHIERELEIANNELKYFELLEFQLTKASIKDLEEIKDELELNQYLKNNYVKPHSKKKVKPNFLVYELDGCKIYVGKNNIQNDYITHKIAQKEDLWFHVKASHGSHVVVSGDNKLNEGVIRFAAKKAMEYSDSNDSSSVPVDYTYIKYLKKVPGRKGSFVTYSKNKTIYID